MTNRFLHRLVKMYDDIYANNPYKRVKVVSFLIHKNKIVSFGVNSDNESLLQAKYRKMTVLKDIVNFIDKEHSEVACLRRTDPYIDFSKCDLVVISKRSDRTLRLSRPCKVCMCAIRDYGIRSIYYANESQSFVREYI